MSLGFLGKSYACLQNCFNHVSGYWILQPILVIFRYTGISTSSHGISSSITNRLPTGISILLPYLSVFPSFQRSYPHLCYLRWLLSLWLSPSHSGTLGCFPPSIKRGAERWAERRIRTSLLYIPVELTCIFQEDPRRSAIEVHGLKIMPSQQQSKQCSINWRVELNDALMAII